MRDSSKNQNQDHERALYIILASPAGFVITGPDEITIDYRDFATGPYHSSYPADFYKWLDSVHAEHGPLQHCYYRCDGSSTGMDYEHQVSLQAILLTWCTTNNIGSSDIFRLDPKINHGSLAGILKFSVLRDREEKPTQKQVGRAGKAFALFLTVKNKVSRVEKTDGGCQ